MLEDIKEVFCSLDDNNKWGAVAGLAWKCAAMQIAIERGVEFSAMKFDANDDEVNALFMQEAATIIEWVLSST